jgi:hypothetical protein
MDRPVDGQCSTEQDEVLLVGNYLHLFPFIARLPPCSGISPPSTVRSVGGGAYCTRELPRPGGNDRTRAKRFRSWGVKTVVPCWTPSLHLPAFIRELGVDHGPQFINFHDWLMGSSNRTDTPPPQLGLTVTVHDNCYSKPLGDACWTRTGRPEKMGCRIVKGACAGGRPVLRFGKGASWPETRPCLSRSSPRGRKIQGAEATGRTPGVLLRRVIYLCGGARAVESEIDVYHCLEIV